MPIETVSVGVILFGYSVMVDHQNLRKKSIICWMITSDIIRLILGWNSNYKNYIIQIIGIVIMCHYCYYLQQQSKYQAVEQSTPKNLEMICNERSGEQQQRIKQIYDELPLGIVVFNDQYLIEQINLTTKKYLNSIKENQNFHEEDLDYLPKLHNFLALAFLNNSQMQEGENSISIREPIENLIGNLCDQTSTLLYTYKDIQTNKWRTVQFKCYKNLDSPLNFTILLVIFDITQKTHSKELKKRITFQTNMLNSFSHELRTPLNSSLQSLEMLRQHIDQKAYQEFVQPALNQNQLLLYQINDILDYAAIQNNSFQYNCVNFNLNTMFQNIIKLYQVAFEQKNIKIIFKLKTTNPCIFNDESRITQVIINLINNSIKFTPNKSQITIQCKQKNNTLLNNLFKIKVKDLGYGISPERLKELRREIKCFKGSGTSSYWISINQIFFGLGLKICNYLCQGLIKFKNENNLIIKSQASKYTHVSFYIQGFKNNTQTCNTINGLTLTESENSVSEKINQLSANQIRLISSLKTAATCNCNKILIVDDIPFNITALKLLLNQYRLSADSAYNGKQALEMVEEKGGKIKCSHTTYNLILMDIEMPIMNGFQATANIKLGKFSTTPVIMCSAYDSLEIREQAKIAGFNDILPKPIKHQNLELLLQKYQCI